MKLKYLILLLSLSFIIYITYILCIFLGVVGGIIFSILLIAYCLRMTSSSNSSSGHSDGSYTDDGGGSPYTNNKYDDNNYTGKKWQKEYHKDGVNWRKYESNIFSSSGYTYSDDKVTQEYYATELKDHRGDLIDRGKDKDIVIFYDKSITQYALDEQIRRSTGTDSKRNVVLVDVTKDNYSDTYYKSKLFNDRVDYGINLSKRSNKEVGNTRGINYNTSNVRKIGNSITTDFRRKEVRLDEKVDFHYDDTL